MSTKKISHPLSQLAPPHTTAVKALLYATIVLKEMALLTLSIDRNEPMTANSSGAVKSGF
jgi:hypothetical protein